MTLAKSGGSSTITTVSGVTNASGVATFTVKDTVAETTTYTATDTTDSFTVTQTATVTFAAGRAERRQLHRQRSARLGHRRRLDRLDRHSHTARRQRQRGAG